MVRLLQSLFTAALALSTLANAAVLPIAGLDKRDVTPVADPVVVDSTGVNMRVTLRDGALIAGYSSVENGQAYIRSARSTDNGKSWTRLGVVTERVASETDLSNAFPLNVNGRLLMAFRNHDKDASGKLTYYRLTVCESTDGGVSWNFLSQLDERTAATPKNGLWEPFLRIAKDGSIQAYYSAENNDGDQDNIMRKSTDGGQNWSSTIPVTGSAVTARDGMVGVAEIGNNQLMVVFESQLTGHMGIYAMVSADDGMTWGSRRQIYAATSGNEAGAPQIIYVGSTIVVNFMSNEAKPELPDVDGGQQKIITSTNNGESWSAAQVLSDLGSHWPGLHTIDSSHFLSLYSFNGKGLVSQEFTL
ncbi:unnamed protein product [Clonostachys rosea]|uniref:Sialidase domain-containing protein n=1 Tax=Bionectria ochroleuca TaxID=29856 RepID=A0ABY6UDH3_BIOOC|nr:unnamed protein product [Clonostachys rosea]